MISSKLNKWIRTNSDEAAAAAGCTFDLRAADKFRRFCRQFLRHSKGQWAGKPFELLDWQWEGIAAPLFGWKRADGSRRFRKGGIWVPKKNGKSTLGAALSLFMLVADGEPGAEIYNAAADRDQASIVFGEAANMVEASPALIKRLEVIRSTKRIVFKATNSWYKALSADVPSKEGWNWHFLLFDELHAQARRDLWDTLCDGGAARRQSLLISISTAGYDRGTIGYEQYLRAKEIWESTGPPDPSFFAYVAEASPEDDWIKEVTWRKANPSLGETIQLDEMRESCLDAQKSPGKQNAFRRRRLNQWTEQATRWLDVAVWDACRREDYPDLRGLSCFGGLDLGATADLCALCLLFPIDEEFWTRFWFWCPEETIKRRERKNQMRYDEWVRGGFIKQTPGNVIDYALIRKDLRDIAGQYTIVELAVDRLFQGAQLCQELQDQEGLTVVAFGQGFFSMAAPTKRFEELVLAGAIHHDGHPVARWNVANASIKRDPAGNMKPDKASSTEKIDGLVGAIMGLGRAMVNPNAGSVYESRGIQTITVGPQRKARPWEDDTL